MAAPRSVNSATRKNHRAKFLCCAPSSNAFSASNNARWFLRVVQSDFFRPRRAIILPHKRSCCSCKQTWECRGLAGRFYPPVPAIQSSASSHLHKPGDILPRCPARGDAVHGPIKFARKFCELGWLGDVGKQRFEAGCLLIRPLLFYCGADRRPHVPGATNSTPSGSPT